MHAVLAGAYRDIGHLVQHDCHLVRIHAVEVKGTDAAAPFADPECRSSSSGQILDPLHNHLGQQLLLFLDGIETYLLQVLSRSAQADDPGIILAGRLRTSLAAAGIRSRLSGNGHGIPADQEGLHLFQQASFPYNTPMPEGPSIL